MFHESQRVINELAIQAFDDQFGPGIEDPIFALESMRYQFVRHLEQFPLEDRPLVAARYALEYRLSLENTRFKRRPLETAQIQVALFAALEQLPEVDRVTPINLIEGLTKYIEATHGVTYDGVDQTTRWEKFVNMLDSVTEVIRQTSAKTNS